MTARLTRRTFCIGAAAVLTGCGRENQRAAGPTTPRLSANDRTAALQRYGLIPDVGADVSVVSQLDAAAGPAGSNTYVGRVTGTESFVGVRVFEDRTISVYVCNGTGARPASLQHWAKGRLDGDAFRLVAPGKPFTPGDVKVAGALQGDRLSGRVEFPDGQAARYSAVAASGQALLLRLEGEVDARVLSHDRSIGDYGIVEHDPEAPKQRLAGDVREGDTVAMGWIRLPNGEVRGGCVCYSGYVWCQCPYGHWHRLDDRCGTAGYDW